MTQPTSNKVVYNFIGLVHYYNDMWERQSHMLEPLTNLTPNKVNLNINTFNRSFLKRLGISWPSIL